MIGIVREVMADNKGRNYYIEGEDGRVYFGQEKDLADLPVVNRGMTVEFTGEETYGKNKQPRATEIKLDYYASECKALYRNKKPKPWTLTEIGEPKKSGWYWCKFKELPTIFPAYYFSAIGKWFTVVNGISKEEPPYIWRKMRFSDEFKGDQEIVLSKRSREYLAE